MIILNFCFILYSNLLKILSLIYIPTICRKSVLTLVSKYFFKIQNINNFNLLEYKNIKEFFIRKINLKTIQNQNTIVSPCEGKIIYSGLNSEIKNLKIKQSIFNYESIFDNKSLTKLYHNGSFLVIYLAPYNYHRFHAPITSKITYLKHLKGSSFPVNPAFKINNVFSINERVILELSNLVMVIVGASGVREIRINNNLNDTVQIGEELGYFGLGSTIILFSNSKIFNNYTNKTLNSLDELFVL